VEKFLLVNIPTAVLGLGMVLVAVGLSLGGLVLVRHRLAHTKLEPHHEVAGFIIAVIGVIYAVLLAFVVIIQWERFTTAEADASTEAQAVGNLYRDGIAVGRLDGGVDLANAVGQYADHLVSSEWPYMAKHQAEEPNTDEYLNAMWKEVTQLQTPSAADAGIVRQAVNDVSVASQMRRKRIQDSGSELPLPLWIVLLIGAALTIGFTYFFGLENFKAQAIMVSTLAAIIALSLFVILTLDLPYTGDVAAKPDALEAEINEFCSYNFVVPAAGENCDQEHHRTTASRLIMPRQLRAAIGPSS
jgi:hypothetical protein